MARVELGAQTYDLRARLNKSPAGAIGIYLAPGANAIETADNVKKILEEAEGAVPAGHGLRHHARFHPADQGLDGGDRADAVRGGRSWC